MSRTAVPVEHVVVSAQVAAATRAELERVAHEGDRSLSAEIRRALTRHLADHYKQKEPSRAVPRT